MKWLALMKASYLDLLLVKCLVIHLGLLIEMSWFVLMSPLMVPFIVLIFKNLLVYCLVFHLDTMTDVSLFLRIVFF